MFGVEAGQTIAARYTSTTALTGSCPLRVAAVVLGAAAVAVPLATPPVFARFAAKTLPRRRASSTLGSASALRKNPGVCSLGGTNGTLVTGGTRI